MNTEGILTDKLFYKKWW